MCSKHPYAAIPVGTPALAFFLDASGGSGRSAGGASTLIFHTIITRSSPPEASTPYTHQRPVHAHTQEGAWPCGSVWRSAQACTGQRRVHCFCVCMCVHVCACMCACVYAHTLLSRACDNPLCQSPGHPPL